MRRFHTTSGVLFTIGCIAGSCAAQGTLYANYFGDADDYLVMFDTETLERTVVGPFGVEARFGELAWDHERRTMYLIDGSSTFGLDSLYTVDLQTGAATFVGHHGIPFLLGLEWDASRQTLYATVGARDTGFYELDERTGESTFVGDPNLHLQSLALDTKRDRLVAAFGVLSTFYEIDRLTGESDLLAFSDYFDSCGMKYDRDRDVFWMIDSDIDSDGNIYKYFPSQSDFWEREHLASGIGRHDGMVYVPDFVTLTITGECPGRITAEVTEATPGGYVALAYAFGEDNRPLPDGRPCAGTWIRLDETARLIGVVRADANGRATLTRNAPPAACDGVFLQAIDIDACAVTDVETL